MNEDIPVYIVDVIEAAVASTNTIVLPIIKANEVEALGKTLIEQVSFHKSSFKELIETLQQDDGSKTLRYKKYPLVYLMRDFKERRGRKAGVYAEVKLRIVIIHQTEATYKITDRETKVFKPVLYPIYYELMNQLWLHPMVIAGPDKDSFVHDKTDRAYWGSVKQLDGNKNALNDYVDAIDITDLELEINFPNCIKY